jgi:Na+-driven multidrug efflux pump
MDKTKFFRLVYFTFSMIITIGGTFIIGTYYSNNELETMPIYISICVLINSIIAILLCLYWSKDV